MFSKKNEIILADKNNKCLSQDGSSTVNAIKFKKSSTSQGTLNSYRSSIRLVMQWMKQNEYSRKLPWMVKLVDEYIADMASGKLSRFDKKNMRLTDGEPLKYNTLQARIAAIKMMHNVSGLISPTESIEIKTTLKGIARVNGINIKKSIPALPDVLFKNLMPEDDDRHSDIRDKALLLIGFSGAFRRSELAALTIGDISLNQNGVDIFIKKSKHDQEGRGQIKAIVRGKYLCPITALKRYMSLIDCTEKDHYLFKRAHKHGGLMAGTFGSDSINKVIKKRLGSEYSGHSLRSGFVTSALAGGADSLKVAEITGHRSLDILREYNRDICRYKSNAGEGIL